MGELRVPLLGLYIARFLRSHRLHQYKKQIDYFKNEINKDLDKSSLPENPPSSWRNSASGATGAAASPAGAAPPRSSPQSQTGGVQLGMWKPLMLIGHLTVCVCSVLFMLPLEFAGLSYTVACTSGALINLISLFIRHGVRLHK
jgi:hypothetical protein